MNWLITTKANTSLDQLAKRLSAWACKLETSMPPIPLGDNEQVISVMGPDDLPRKIKKDGTILKISPNSEIELI